jgi:hypothetical protein
MRIGRLPLEVVRAHVSDVLVVDEAQVESAIALLAEGAKQVAEGAGAAALAAVMTNPERFAGRRIGLPVCGGNIDSRILANVLLRNLLRDGRLLRVQMEIPDRYRDEDRQFRGQHHRGLAPAPVRLAIGAGRPARGDGGSARSRACGGDPGRAARELCGGAGLRSTCQRRSRSGS